MSVHLVSCAAESALRPAEKLVLMCFADSASKETGVAYPGLDDVMTWSTLGKRQTLAVIAKLVDGGFLQRRGGAHRGRRAEFLVFPNGCCPQHGAVDPRGSDAPNEFTEMGAADSTQTPREEGCAALHPIEKGCDFEPRKGAGMGAIATAPLPYLQVLTPPPTASLSTADTTAEEEAQQFDEMMRDVDVVDADEFVAQLSCAARESGGNPALWSARLVLSAVRDALAAGFDLADMPPALRELAADPTTIGPARLREAGPWWRARARAEKLTRARSAHHAAEAKAARRRDELEQIDTRRSRQRELFDALDDDTLERLHAAAIAEVDAAQQRAGVSYSAGMRARLVTTGALAMAVADGLVPELDAIDIDTEAAYA
jgi:hypothetical protein